MNTTSLSGIVYYGPDKTLQRLQLDSVRVNAFILDVSSRISISQSYTNTGEAATGGAKYVLPLPARSALCAFEMRCDDGRVVTGVVKQKDEARKKYEEALKENKIAGLVEWVSDDVFTISLGNIRSRQTVAVNFVYVMDLIDYERVDHVRFQIPMCLGERYGLEPVALVGAERPSTCTRVKIVAQIQMYRGLQSVSSPTHEDSLSVEPYSTHHGQVSRRRAVAKMHSSNYLTGDFVLIIHAKGLDAPRCFAEIDERFSIPGSKGLDAKTIALQLTFVPKFRLPPIPSQEYIFVIDRSGSMSGSKIVTARTTLGLLLRMLPNNGSTFNIFSFGTRCSSIWGRSSPYTKTSLDQASVDVVRMEADYGGTEIRAALKQVFSSRNINCATAVFVLTDGEAYDVDGTIQTVTSAVALASTHAPLRVFTLGIGTVVSTAMVEGIAAAGHGTCLLTVSAEGIIGKCAQLFRVGRASTLKNVSIDWGVSSETTASKSPEPASLGATIQLHPPPFIQQSPSISPDINPSTRCRIFAIISKRSVPESVTVRGQLDGQGDEYEITIPVQLVRVWKGNTDGLPLVHILAARSLIRDLEIGNTPPPVAIHGAPSPDGRKEMETARLGVRYQLTSRYTSFVAIESGVICRPREVRSTMSPIAEDHDSSMPPGVSQNSPADDDHQANLMMRPWAWVAGIFGSLFSTKRAPLQVLHENGAALSDETFPEPPGAWPVGSQRHSRPADGSPVASEDEYYSDDAASYSTMSSLMSYSSSDWTPPPTPRRAVKELPSHYDGVPAFEPVENAPEPIRREHEKVMAVHPALFSPKQDALLPTIVELVSLQAFDGSFSPTPALARLVGADALRAEVDSANVDLWATALAVAYMKKHLSLQPDLLAGLLEKATEFARAGQGEESDADDRERRFDGLVSRALTLVV